MNISNIENLSGDLFALLSEYNRLKEIESRSFDLQITEAQREKIKDLHSFGHRNLYTQQRCYGAMAVILPLSFVTGEIRHARDGVLSLYCSTCAQITHINREGEVV